MKKIILSIALFLVMLAAVNAVEYESPVIKVTLLNQDPSPARAGDTNVVVIGNRVAKTTFKQPLVLNRGIQIEGRLFKVVGILKESGGFGGDDNRIIMPIEQAREILENAGREKYDSIAVKAANVDLVDRIVAEIDSKLMVSKHVTARNKDYSVTSSKATQERLQDITKTFTIFLGAIAAVSLLVGAVGIANTMFTSVLELFFCDKLHLTFRYKVYLHETLSHTHKHNSKTSPFFLLQKQKIRHRGTFFLLLYH